MRLCELLENYGGNACISIDGYCEETKYDYYSLPDPDDEDFAGNNPNHYVPSCLAREQWYDEIKNREVTFWNIIGGEFGEPVELCIELGDDLGEEGGE